MADDTYTVERSVTVDAPQAKIYEHLADFHNWRAWSPWEDVDPELERCGPVRMLSASMHARSLPACSDGNSICRAL